MATGHAMMGLSLAPVTGRLVKDLLTMGPAYAIHNKLNPSRFS
jgi:glycine/D-amino acid oxidase-like deaminating enzyme